MKIPEENKQQIAEHSKFTTVLNTIKHSPEDLITLTVIAEHIQLPELPNISIIKNGQLVIQITHQKFDLADPELIDHLTIYLATTYIEEQNKLLELLARAIDNISTNEPFDDKS